jgi:hypothetical protein
VTPIDATSYAAQRSGTFKEVHMESRVRKPIIGTAAVVMVIVAGSAAPAFAGEVTGNGTTTPIAERANSACAFSGLDDNRPGTGIVEPGVVQNYGHTKDSPAVLASKGASSVTIDFGVFFPGGPVVTEGCNARMYPGK